ncbi:MAG: condensation domain-containing protein, partial [Acidobacteria bacterium]|nr:condensation domain-containing protein [Acidobacteriota bacterium]
GALEFDASTFEIWGALLNGLMFLLIKKEEVLSPKKLYENLIKYDISIMWLTSSLFNHLLEADIKIFSVLRHLLVGGESLSTRHINKLRARFAHLNIINGYGPTENTTFSTTFRIDKEYEENIPIGKPIANSTAFIINNWHGIQPIGAIGELYVGGYGVARGYLNNPELTADKFKPLITQMEQMTQMKNKNNALGANFQHSALIIQHSNLYCTGDLVRWLEDGNIEFLGRIDRQVKIRGFRIEPGEIERHILVYKDIKEAVVIDNLVNEEKSLCAYIVNQKEKGIDISKLLQYLSNLMPDFMIPAYFITIDKLPLTANGKINRQALPKPEIKPLEQFISYRNKTEELLAEIWSNILGLEKEKIGIDDNFFSCGGHSLKAIQLSGKIHKHFDLKISITAIFNNPTIRALAEYIESKKTITTIRDFVPLEAIEKKTYYELSAGQQNIYLFQQMYPNSTAYHISSAIEPTGEANPAVLREIFKKMILRHESLRTSFIQVEGKPFQRVHDQVEFDLEILGDRDQKAGVTAFIRPFDLSRAPLLRVGLLKKQDGGTILLIDIHHIIADGTSVDILTREFETFQAGSQLPFPAIQYKDFCLWQDRICQREEMKTHERYWLELLKAPLPLLQLATDFPRFEEQNLDGDSIHYALGKELTQEIYEYLKETNATLYMLLLTVFNILLHRYTGQEDIIISSPFAGRDHDDLENVVGLLIGALPMRNFPREYKTFSQFLEEIKKSTLQAYENRWYPYEEILRKVDYPKHTGHTPISDISLLVQNTGIGNGSREQQFSRLAFYEELFPKNSKVDMTLIIEEKAGDIFLSLEYRAGLFKRESMERLVRHLVNVLQNGIADPGIYLSHIEMLTPHEKQQISGTFNSYYPLSHAQKRIYYMDKRYVGAPVANLGTVFRYAQVLDMNLLEIAINKVIEKNDALRLRIIESPFEKEPIQYVVPFERQAIEFIDFSRNGNDNERRVQECVNALSAAPFDTLNGPLYYFAMLKFNEKETGFYLKNHHIIADGWAVCTLLVNQIDQIYEELYSGKIGKESTYFSYLDYLTDEKKYLASKQVEIDKTYWYNLLLPLPSPVRLSDRENNDFNVKSGSSEFILPHILIQEIYAYIESTGKITSIFKLLFSVFSIYISRITGLDDFVIGSACHNRVDDRQKQTIGMFAGTIPIR